MEQISHHSGYPGIHHTVDHQGHMASLPPKINKVFINRCRDKLNKQIKAYIFPEIGSWDLDLQAQE